MSDSHFYDIPITIETVVPVVEVVPSPLQLSIIGDSAVVSGMSILNVGKGDLTITQIDVSSDAISIQRVHGEIPIFVSILFPSFSDVSFSRSFIGSRSPN